MRLSLQNYNITTPYKKVMHLITMFTSETSKHCNKDSLPILITCVKMWGGEQGAGAKAYILKSRRQGNGPPGSLITPPM